MMRRAPVAGVLVSAALVSLAGVGACSLSLDGYSGPPIAPDAGVAADAAMPGAEPADAQPPSDAMPSSKPIVFVQTNANGQQVAGSTSFSVSFDAPVADHDTLVAALYVGPKTANITNVTDTLGNTFQILGDQVIDSYDIHEYLVAASDITGGTADAITVHSAGFDHMNLLIHEYANAGPPIGCTHATGDGAGTNGILAPALTVPTPGTLLFAYALAGAVTAGTGFDTRSTFDHDVTEDRRVGTPGPASAIATVASGQTGWAIIAAGFGPK